MARAAAVVALAVGGALWTSAAIAAGPFGSIHVGAWNGGAFTDDNTGAFSHCAAQTGYASGVTLVVGQNAAGAWLLGFSHPSWRIAAGEISPIDVTFDGQAQFHLFGTGVTTIMMTAILPNNAAIEQFRKSNLMAATTRGQTFQFNLTSTGQLLPVVANCVAKAKTGGINSAGDFSVLPPKPAAAAASAKSGAAASAAAPSGAKAPKLVDINGTGFVVSPDGHILTNNHVISECVGDVRGNLTGEGAMKLRIVSTDEINDLALLQAPRSFKQPATLRGTPMRSGESIIAIGYPFHGLLTSDFTVTSGIVSSLSGLLNDTRFLQISAPVQPGNSGGPLLDTSGNVVGVVAEKINALKFAKATGDMPENINFAIKTGAVRDFLDNSVVSYQTSEPGAEMKTEQIASNARAFTLLISCTANEAEIGKK
jgi:S1-C subfamily serine protease